MWRAPRFSPFAAHSADLAVKAPPPPVFSWTGANIGGALANNNWTDTLLQMNFNNNNGAFI